MLVSHSGNAEKAVADYAATNAILHAACDSQTVQKYMSAADFLPTIGVQTERIARWNAYFSTEKRAKIAAQLRQSAQKVGFASDAFDRFSKLSGRTTHRTTFWLNLLGSRWRFRVW